ncbi:MAG: hypothetical protein Q8Q74_11750 [Polaromonas sp.]|nr:hypothetical protein [Polaromonas sp.]
MMEAFFEDAAMKLPTPTPFKPYIAYLTSVCASMAAAAAVVTETVPLTVGGF